MFKCHNCGKQSQPGEGSSVVPTITRPTLYQYSDGPCYMGTEWAKSAIVCESCSIVNVSLPLQTVKTIEIKVQHERTRIQDKEQYVQG